MIIDLHQHLVTRRSAEDLGPSRHRCQPKRSGFVMVIVMVTILATAAFAAVQQRTLQSALRLEQARLESERNAAGPKSALAIAVERLHTGQPTSDGGSVDYRLQHTVTGETITYRVTYSRSGNEWTVTVNPDPSASSLVDLPTDF